MHDIFDDNDYDDDADWYYDNITNAMRAIRHTQPKINYQTSRTARIKNLDSTNEHFKYPRTVYVADGHKLKKDGRDYIVPGVSYNYSDRIWQWDYDKSRKAWAVTQKILGEEAPDLNTAECIEQYLRFFHDAPNLELIHVKTGYNLSNGYPYRVYGYIIGEEDTEWHWRDGLLDQDEKEKDE